MTKDFVNSEIATAEQKDNQEEQAEYAKIYQKIADISAGGGVDLSPYLKIEDASANFATKSEIPSVEGYATTEYVNSEIQRVEEEIPSVENLATKNELEAVAAQIPDVSDFVTEQTVDEKIATEIAKVVADAPEDFDTLKEVADYIASDKTRAAEIETAISNLQNNKADVSTVYTKEQADAKFLTEHQDISGLATKAEVNAALEEKADKSEIPSLEGYATKSEVNAALENKADKADIPVVPTVVSAFENDAHYLTEHQDISNLASKDELEAVEAQIPDVSAALEPYALKTELPDTTGLASKAEVNAALENKADKAEIPVVPTVVSAFENDANYLTQHQDISNLATKQEVADGDASVLNNVLGKMWNKGTDCFYTKKTINGKTALLFNESDGGGSIYETSELKSFVGVNDGGDVSTGVHVQIYSKSKADNKGARLNVNPTGIFYGVGTSAVISPETELAVKGDIPSVEGLATTEALNTAVNELNADISQKADTVDVSSAIESVETVVETKADAESVPTKTEFEALKANYEELKQLVFEYLPNAADEATADGQIEDLSPSNKNITIDTSMASIEVPATTTLYTVAAPLRENSVVELTSDYSFSFDNLSEQPVDTTFKRETAVGETKVTGTTINLSGVFNDVTLENISIATRNGKDPATFANITIPETNEKELSITAQILDGATIKNDSDKQITITNRIDQGSEVVLVSPNSTVVLNGGTFTTLTSETADNTLIVNVNTNIDKLVLKKGSVCVKDFDVSARISEVEDLSGGQYEVYPYEVEVNDPTKFASTLTSTSGIIEVTDDLEGIKAAGFSLFANNRVRLNLNNHTISGGNNNYVIYTRGTAVVDI